MISALHRATDREKLHDLTADTRASLNDFVKWRSVQLR
jgi:hypothetical protein